MLSFPGSVFNSTFPGSLEMPSLQPARIQLPTDLSLLRKLRLQEYNKTDRQTDRQIVTSHCVHPSHQVSRYLACHALLQLAIHLRNEPPQLLQLHVCHAPRRAHKRPNTLCTPSEPASQTQMPSAFPSASRCPTRSPSSHFGNGISPNEGGAFTNDSQRERECPLL
jgi:hypothetical protein